MDMKTTATGPLFDGRAEKAVADFLGDATRDVADRGVNEVRSRLGQAFQNPTGSYRSKVVTDRASTDGWAVTDGGVVYGPWLEGVGSRNKSTRFKGYQTFRRTAQWLDGKAGGIAETTLKRFLPRMGGN